MLGMVCTLMTTINLLVVDTLLFLETYYYGLIFNYFIFYICFSLLLLLVMLYIFKEFRICYYFILTDINFGFILCIFVSGQVIGRS